jgi:hypothetical protein
VNRLRTALLEQAKTFEVAADAPRLGSLARATTLIETLVGDPSPARVIRRLARADLGEVPEIVAKTMSRAEALERSMAGIKWQLFEGVRKLPAARGEAGRTLVEELRGVLAIDEQATALAPKLVALEKQALALLTAPPVPSPVPGKIVTAAGWASEEIPGLSPSEARVRVAELEERSLKGEEIQVDLVVRTRKSS